MIKVLVAYGAGNCSTGEVALAIGHQLTRIGLSVDLRPFGRISDATSYAAVVAGSAVVDGHWEKSALAYLHSQPDELAHRTRLFQWTSDGGSGAVDAEIRQWMAVHADLEPVTFSGVLGPWSPVRHLWSTTSMATDDRWLEIYRWAYSLGTTLRSELALAG